jgi:nitric oxide reductase NorD protein
MLPRRPRVRPAGDDEDDREPGTWLVRADDPQEKVEDPGGLQRPSDRDAAADPGALADALSELPSARLVRTPDIPAEVLASEDPLDPTARGESDRRGGGIIYPEWDWRVNGYRPLGAIVRERTAPVGDETWADAALRHHAILVRAVRRDFERLRTRRAAFRRQPDGADVDIDAYVTAHADALGHGTVDDRLYLDARRTRRDHAIVLLVDASASTDAWVAGNHRIVDVEKHALLVVCEALAAMGDPYSVLAFSGEGPGHVEVQVVKQFHEPGGTNLVRRRIAALEPEGYTRAGAALRHATLRLARASARHQVLLVLSDGRPNDVDVYEGPYGVEDTRMAVIEARARGIACFCLTVDRAAPRYAARIFGPTHFAVLSRTERLPWALSNVLRRLIRR